MRSGHPPEECDTAIVGGGAAGCEIASLLAAAGRDVVVLDAGPEWQLSDLVSSQIDARRLKWAEPVAELGGSHPVLHNFNCGWGIGGAALHHGGVWLRAQPDDFKLASRYGSGLDWPIEYDDLRSDYDEIQQEVGLSGDHERETWRPPAAPYPNPPLPVFAQGRLIQRGFSALGIPTAPMPRAILSRPYGGRPACIHDGWCDAGCPTGALANPLVVSLQKARKGGARFKPRHFVERVLTSGIGKVTGVECRTRDGEKRVVHARTVVLAAYAVQNSRILLNSASHRHPDGLANSSGLVGKYFNAHAMVPVFGFFREGTENHLGTASGQIYVQAGRRADPGGAFGSYQWQCAGAMKPNDFLGLAGTRPDLYGQNLMSFMTRASRELAVMSGIAEALPLATNRIELSSHRDRAGARVARIEHALSERSRALLNHIREEGHRILAHAGAQDIWSGGPDFSHLSGGTIMGSDPRHSVTNSFGQAHDLPGLYVAGASLFPTSGSFNPTFTVYALARRTARHMLRT